MASNYFFKTMADLTVIEKERLTKELNKFERVDSGCKVWKGGTSRNGYGELRITIRGKRIRLKAHRAVYALAHRTLTMTDTMDVSHVCHNKLCVNLEHLSYEPHSVNNNRMVCKNDGECYGHHGFMDCIL